MLITLAVGVGLAILKSGLTYLMDSNDHPPIKGPWSGDAQRFRPVDGDPIPVVFGTVDVAPAVVWEGPLLSGIPGEGTSATVEGGGSVVTTSTNLNAQAFHWVICAGPVDKISEVTIKTDAERALRLWGEDSPENPLVFNGIGEVSADGVDVRWVPSDRPVDPDALSVINSVEARVLSGAQTAGLPTDAPGSPWGADIGFRHVTSMYGRLIAGPSFLVGGENNYELTGATPGALRMRVTRIFSRSFDERPSWYESKATLDGYNMNPVHVLHDILTDRVWGPTHLDASDIDDASFKAAADLMYSEGIFMSALLSAPEEASTLLAQIFALCNAAPYQEPTTGKYCITIATDDYNPATVPVFGDSNSSGEMVRQYAKNMATRMTVTYTKGYKRPSHLRTSPAPVPPDEERKFSQTNPAMYDKYGEVEATHDYREIRTSKAASKLATRDLLALSKPLAALSMTTEWGVDGARDLRPGSPFIWGSAIAGIDPIAYRVTSVDFGSGTDPAIKIEAIEDAFAFPAALEPDPPDSQWEPSYSAPVPATPREAFQLPLWLWYQLDLETDPYALLSDHQDDGRRPYALAAGRPTSDARDFALHVDGLTRRAGESFVAFYTTAQVIEQADTEIVLADEAVALDFGSEFTPIIMVAGELMEVHAWDAATKTATVCRGWLDTVPKFTDTPAGADVAVIGALYDGGDRFARFFSTDRRLSASTVDIKALTRTSSGQLSPADAPTDTLDMLPWRGGAVLPRSLLPLAPAHFRTSATGGGIDLTWSVRDRIDSPQCDNFVDPKNPFGFTYTVEIRRASDDSFVREVSGIAENWWDYPNQMQSNDGVLSTDDLIFILWAVDSSGRESWQKYTRLHTR